MGHSRQKLRSLLRIQSDQRLPSFRPEGQNIALYALPPSRDSTFLIFAFPGHSILLKKIKKKSGEEPGLNNWRLDLNPADVTVSHRYTHAHTASLQHLVVTKEICLWRFSLFVPLTFQTDRAALSRGGCTDFILSTVLHWAALDGAGHSPSLALTPRAFVHDPLLSWLQNNISNAKNQSRRAWSQEDTEQNTQRQAAVQASGKMRVHYSNRTTDQKD